MPAPVLAVHDEQDICELAVSTLRAALLEVVGFEDPIAALDAIETDSRVHVLVTRVVFGPGKPNGVALARMIRLKRPGTRLCSLRAQRMSHTRKASAFFCRGRLIPIFWWQLSAAY
jgi:DNA-binding NtrC family response regulator